MSQALFNPGGLQKNTCTSKIYIVFSAILLYTLAVSPPAGSSDPLVMTVLEMSH